MRRFGCGAARLHLALAVEQDALLDEERGGVDVAAHPARGVNLHAPLGHDVAAHGALNHDGADRYLGVDFRALTDDEHVLGEDLAGQLAVHADGPFEGQLALELAASAKQGGDLRGGAGLASCGRLWDCRHDSGAEPYNLGHRQSTRSGGFGS